MPGSVTRRCRETSTRLPCSTYSSTPSGQAHTIDTGGLRLHHDPPGMPPPGGSPASTGQPCPIHHHRAPQSPRKRAWPIPGRIASADMAVNTRAALELGQRPCAARATAGATAYDRKGVTQVSRHTLVSHLAYAARPYSWSRPSAIAFATATTSGCARSGSTPQA
jgi:hypothetical protein